MTHAAITGWGKCLPPAVLSNHDLSTLLDTSDEWIVSRTGIRERRISHVGLEELAYVAAARALAAAGVAGADVELIVFGTCSHDDQVPNMASGIQARIGASASARLRHQHRLHQLPLRPVDRHSALIRTGVVRNALVIGAELISPFMDWSDRDVAVLFGDGAAAVVLEASEREEGLLAEKLGCFGEARDILRVQGMGGRYANHGVLYGVTRWQFEGQEIFKRAVAGMASACEYAARAPRVRAGGRRPARAAPGEPAHHRGRGQARARADGAGVREHPALRQHVRRHRRGGAVRGHRGGARAPRGPAAAARLRRWAHLLRAPGALGRASDPARAHVRRAAAQRASGARAHPRAPRAQARPRRIARRARHSLASSAV